MQSNDLPPIENVVLMPLHKAMALLARLDEESDDISTRSQCVERLLEIYRDKGIRQTSPPVLTQVVETTAPFEAKWEDLRRNLAAIKYFFDSKESRRCLNELGLDVTKQVDNFEEAGSLERLVLLVAGTTASGKSTLINGLLRIDLLPTGHNATTSVSCEIKWGPAKEAVIYLASSSDTDTFDEREKLKLSLEKEEDCETFASYVSCNRAASDSSQPVCYKVEVFLPLDFLKKLTIIDSPGVSEADELSPASRKITEECQANTPCHLIYVINAEDAAEVGAQVGGLLVAMARKRNSQPSILFVVNKWDRFLDKFSSGSKRVEEEEKYFKRLYGELKQRWKDFEPSQVIKMNSHIAGMAHQLGAATSDMERLRDAISKTVVNGTKQKIMKALRKPMELLEKTEQIIDATVRRSRLSDKERKEDLERKVAELEKFRSSVTGGKIARLRTQLDDRIDSAVEELCATLLEDKNVREALKLGKSTEAQALLDEGDLRTFVDLRLERTVTNHSSVKELKEAIEFHLGPMTSAEMTALVCFASSVFPTVLPIPLEETDLEKSTFQRRASGFEAGTAKSRPSSFFSGITKLVRRKKIRKSLESEYRKAVETRLRPTVVRAIAQKSLAANHLRRATTLIDDLDKELSAWQKRYTTDDLEKYKDVQSNCKKLISRASSYLLELGVEDYTDEDVIYLDDCTPIARGQFSRVCKVELKPIKRKAALKIFNELIGSSTSASMVREWNCCRKLERKKNSHLVEFYGLVSLGDSPASRQIGLAFEWCSGGTLAREIYAMKTGASSPGRTLTGYTVCVRLIAEIVSGVAFLHDEALVHRDLKPENILLTTDKKVKIADFGLTKNVERITGSYGGTEYYMAPEVQREEPYGFPADVFSIGIIVWEMWQGERCYTNNDQSPPKGLTEPTGDFAVAQPNAFDSWRDLMEWCWSSRPSDRPLAREIYKIVSEW